MLAVYKNIKLISTYLKSGVQTEANICFDKEFYFGIVFEVLVSVPCFILTNYYIRSWFKL